MAWQALVAPRKGTRDGTGWCLRYAQSFFGAPARYNSAWDAWNATQYKHGPNEPLPDVPVLLWFSHYGTYGSPPRYGNWGHVAIHVPGDAIYTSPASGWGFGRYGTIREIERVFNARYVGWSEDINGLRVAVKETEPQHQEEDMIKLWLYTPTNSLILADHLNMTLRNLGNKQTVERAAFDRMPYTKIEEPAWTNTFKDFDYITAPNVVTDGLDVNALGAKIAADLAKNGVQGDAEATAVAVQRILADEFESLKLKNQVK